MNSSDRDSTSFEAVVRGLGPRRFSAEELDRLAAYLLLIEGAPPRSEGEESLMVATCRRAGVDARDSGTTILRKLECFFRSYPIHPVLWAAYGRMKEPQRTRPAAFHSDDVFE